MKRRDLIKSTAAVSAGALAGLGQAARPDAAEPDAAKRQSPNILFVLVDELRFPTVFPAGVRDADQFFAKFMPNLHKRLWTQGVKFGKHFTAASACTPARGVLISGLYRSRAGSPSPSWRRPTPASHSRRCSTGRTRPTASC